MGKQPSPEEPGLPEGTIAVGCDHRGLDLKQEVLKVLTELGYAYQDLGCYEASTVDYPDVAQRVAQEVTHGRCRWGILICNTGIGMSITANKVRGIRAALCHDPFSARMAREHNDANLLCMGAAVMDRSLLKEVLLAFFNSRFEGGRHARRVEKIKALEDGRLCRL